MRQEYNVLGDLGVELHVHGNPQPERCSGCPRNPVCREWERYLVLFQMLASLAATAR